METKFKGTTEQWVLDGELLMTKDSEMVIADFYPNTEYTNISDIDFSQTRANMLLASKSQEMLEMIEELLKELEFHGYRNSTTIYNAKQLVRDATEFNQIY